MSLPFCPSAGAARPFPPPAGGEIPAQQRRIAYATRLHRKTAAEEWAAAQPRRVLTRLVCPGGRLLRKNCFPTATIGFSRCKQLFSHHIRFPCPLLRFFARPVSHYFCWDNKIFALFTNFLDIYCNLRKLFKCPTKKVNILRSIFRQKASSKLTYLTRVVDNIDKTTRFFYSFIQTAQIHLDKEFEK